VVGFNYPLIWVYIKTCPPDMCLHTSLTHYHLQHASLPDPRMERASILPLWSVSKAYHLFGADHVWIEMLGVSWHWLKWLCRLLYLHFINWWLQLQYCYSHGWSNFSLLGVVSLNGSTRWGWAQLPHQKTMSSMRRDIVTMKLNAMYVGGTWVRIWFGVLVCKAKSTTSISVHDNLTFVKYMYVDVIAVRPRFVQQEWGVQIREGRVDQSRSKDVVCIVYFKKTC
jgi:hypothetical protein